MKDLSDELLLRAAMAEDCIPVSAGGPPFRHLEPRSTTPGGEIESPLPGGRGGLKRKDAFDAMYASMLVNAMRIVNRPGYEHSNLDPAEVAMVAILAIQKAQYDGRYLDLTAESPEAVGVLYQFARNAARDLLRKEGRHHHHRMAMEEVDQQKLAVDPPPEEQRAAYIEEAYERIRQVATPREWEVVVKLRTGASKAQVAAELGISVNAVDKILSRVRQALKLAPKGNGDDMFPQTPSTIPLAEWITYCANKLLI